MLLAWNASSSIVKQSKNKTTWLTHAALSKSSSVFLTTYIEDIK